MVNFSLCVSVIQGARVWVREKEQLVPATVNSCGDGTLVVTTDYGEVRNAHTHTHAANRSNLFFVLVRFEVSLF